MAELEFPALISRLAERTAQGKVNWKPTTDPTEFVLYFQKYSLSMRRGVDEEQDEFIAFSLRNEAGKKIDEIWVWQFHGNWADTSNMWAAARRRALRIDEALEGLLAEIQEKDVVGEDAGPKIDPEIDDLPF